MTCLIQNVAIGEQDYDCLFPAISYHKYYYLNIPIAPIYSDFELSELDPLKFIKNYKCQKLSHFSNQCLITKKEIKEIDSYFKCSNCLGIFFGDILINYFNLGYKTCPSCNAIWQSNTVYYNVPNRLDKVNQILKSFNRYQSIMKVRMTHNINNLK